MERIEIPLSKKKVVLLAFGSFLFVGLGFFLVFYLSGQQTPFPPEIIRIVGISAIVFFSLTGFWGTKKLFDKRIALVLDGVGITDFTSGTSVGLIKWSDIVNIRTIKIQSVQILLIDVRNPESYIEMAKGFKARIMRMNHSAYGTPLSISSTTIGYKFEELEQLIRKYNTNYNSNTLHP